MQTSGSIRRTAMAAAPVTTIAGFWLGGGNRAAAGAVLGLAMVVLFFAGGRAPMLLASSVLPGQLFLLVALGYLLRVVLLLAVLVNLGGASWLDRRAVAATVIGGALLWTVSLVHAHLRSGQPTLQLPPPAQVAVPR